MDTSQRSQLSFAVILLFGAGAAVLVVNKGSAAIDEIEKLSNNQIVATRRAILADQLGEDKIDTSHWKIYRNEKYGFEVKYPEDWYLDPLQWLDKGGPVMFTNMLYGPGWIMPNGAAEVLIDTRGQAKNVKNIEGLFEQDSRFVKNTILSRDTMSIVGVNATRVVYSLSDGMDTYSKVAVYLPQQNKTIIFSLEYFKDDINEQKFRNVFNKILSTFRFVQ